MEREDILDLMEWYSEKIALWIDFLKSDKYSLSVHEENHYKHWICNFAEKIKEEVNAL